MNKKWRTLILDLLTETGSADPDHSSWVVSGRTLNLSEVRADSVVCLHSFVLRSSPVFIRTSVCSALRNIQIFKIKQR